MAADALMREFLIAAIVAAHVWHIGIDLAHGHTIPTRGTHLQDRLCTRGTTVGDFKRYARTAYRRATITRQARQRIRRLHVCPATYPARRTIGRLHDRYADARARRLHPPISPLAACIIRTESGGDPQADNGTHYGIAQWTLEAWARHGGHRFAPHPHGATYMEQVWVLMNGLRRYGCRDWCPFDGCG